MQPLNQYLDRVVLLSAVAGDTTHHKVSRIVGPTFNLWGDVVEGQFFATAQSNAVNAAGPVPLKKRLLPPGFLDGLECYCPPWWRR